MDDFMLIIVGVQIGAYRLTSQMRLNSYASVGVRRAKRVAAALALGVDIHRYHQHDCVRGLL